MTETEEILLTLIATTSFKDAEHKIKRCKKSLIKDMQNAKTPGDYEAIFNNIKDMYDRMALIAIRNMP